MKNLIGTIQSNVISIWRKFKGWVARRYDIARSYFNSKEEETVLNEETLLAQLEELSQVMGFSYTAERSEAVSGEASVASDTQEASEASDFTDTMEASVASDLTKLLLGLPNYKPT